MSVIFEDFDYDRGNWVPTPAVMTDTDAKVSVVMARCKSAGGGGGIKGSFGGGKEPKCDVYARAYGEDSRGNKFHGEIWGNNTDGYEYDLHADIHRSFERERESSRCPDSRERE